MGKKLIVMLISILLIFAMLPSAAFADGDVEEYAVYVVDTRVTSENADDVLNDGGSVRFDPDNNVLTLENAKITGPEDGASISAYDNPLTIKLIGDSTISGSKTGISVMEEGLSIEGKGTLDIKTSGESIFCWGNLFISDTTLTATSGTNGIRCNIPTSAIVRILGSEVNIVAGNGYAISAHRPYTGSTNAEIVIEKGSKVTAKGTYGAISAEDDLTISDSTVTASCNADGTVIGSEDGSLTISGSSIEATGGLMGLNTYRNSKDITIKEGSAVIIKDSECSIYSDGGLNISNSNVLADTASEGAVILGKRPVLEDPVTILVPKVHKFVQSGGSYSIYDAETNEEALKVLIGTPCTISVTAEEGGSVTGAGTYDPFSSVTLSATPDEKYVFDGWVENGEIISTDDQYTFTVKGDRDITAAFHKVATIVFKDADGTVLQSSEEAYGEMPEYNGETPSKEADADYYYTFDSWTPELAEVTEDATYTATFSSTPRTYGDPVWDWLTLDEDHIIAAAFFTTVDGYEEFNQKINADVSDPIITDATCTEDGKKEYVATITFKDKKYTDTKVVVLPALGHDLAHHEGKEATCTEKGWKEYDTCNRCDYTSYEEIPAMGHDRCPLPATEGSCTEDSLEEGEWCPVCGTIFVEQKVSPAPGHDWSEWETDGGDPCTDDHVLRRVCRRCGEVEEKSEAALGHDYSGSWVVTEEPTCTRPGTEATTCTRCSQSDRFRDIPALGHDWGEWKVTKEATETEEGIETRTCKRNSSHTETRAIPVLEHKHVLTKVAAVAQTCTEDGNIEYWICDGGENPCGKYFADENGKNTIEKKDTVVKATGHDWGEWKVTKEATETEEGIETRTCKRDSSHAETRAIPVLGHKHVLTKVAEADPTCTEKGNVEYWVCDGGENPCGKYFADENGKTEIEKKDTVIKATGHKWGKWKVISKASPVDKGKKQRVCKNDPSHVQTKTIPVLTKPLLLARMTEVGNTKLTIKWNKVKKADGYEIFFSQCFNDDGTLIPKRVKTIKSGSVTSWTKKGLKKGTPYKGYVRAYRIKNGKKEYLNTSPWVHAFVGGSSKNYTNVKSVKVEKTKVTLKKGKTSTIKAKVTKVKKNKKYMPKYHAPRFRYYSSNTKIATVSTSGKIKAKKKGTCSIYVIAQNGAYKKITVRVK